MPEETITKSEFFLVLDQLYDAYREDAHEGFIPTRKEFARNIFRENASPRVAGWNRELVEQWATTGPNDNE